MSSNSEAMLLRVKVRLTRSGYHFSFVAMFTVVGAVVRDLNLLAILAGLLIGTLLVQWRFARGSLLGLIMSRRLPPEVFVGEVLSVRYRVVNTRYLLPCWFLQIEEPIVSESNVREVGSGHAVIGRIACQDEQLGVINFRIAQRGRYCLGPARIATEFPFGLIRASRCLDRREDIVVYPRLGRLRKGWRSWLMSDQSGLAVSRRRAGVNEGDFYGLRDWQNGDSRRWIHWRTTARIGELAVRQFEPQQRQQIGILIDLYQDVPSDDNLERLISFAATLVNAVLRNPENQISFTMSGGEAISNVNCRGSEFRRRVLGSLATARRGGMPMLDDRLKDLVGVCSSNWPVMIASTRPVNYQALAGDGTSESVIGQLDLRWLNLADPSSHQVFMETADEN